MPPLEWGRYLVDHLFEMGPTMAAGAGSGPLTFAEMEAWQRLTGVALTPWESQLIRQLSNEYLAESFDATQENRPAPYRGQALIQQQDRDNGRKLKQFLS